MVKYTVIMASEEVGMEAFYKREKNKNKNSANGALKCRVLIMIICCLMVFAAPLYVNADPGNLENEIQGINTGVKGGAFEVTAYDFDAVVGKDHSYRVTEVISVSIPDQLQRIEFAIPSGNFRLSDVSVEGLAFEVSTSSDSGRLAITDPEGLSKGDHQYTVSYVIREYKDLDSAKDMFYFNAMLPQWMQPVGKVTVNVSFPEDFPFDDMQCYSGQFGVQDVNSKIKFTTDDDAHKVTVTGSMIPENFSITLKAQLPEGYWQDTLDGTWSIMAITFVMGGAALILFVLWLIGGRDPRVKRQTVTKPIEGMSPVELGYVFNSEVRTRDVLNMILQFAQKGYLRISEYEPKRYRLIKGNSPAGEEKMYRNAYSILFEDVYKDRALDMDDIAARVERIRTNIEDDVAAGFASGESRAFTPLSRAFRYIGAAVLGISIGASNALSYFYAYRSPNLIESILVGAVAAAASLLLCRAIDDRDSSERSAYRVAEILSALALAVPVIYASYRVSVNINPAVALPMIMTSVLATFLIVIMRARGKENAALVSRIRRLRNFIYHPTPKELLENHLADSNYYYDMLLYALAFGAEESWAISFLTLDVPEPEWYSDDIEGHAFSNLRVKPTTIDYARDLRSFIRTFDNN